LFGKKISKDITLTALQSALWATVIALMQFINAYESRDDWHVEAETTLWYNLGNGWLPIVGLLVLL
jgi:hypothetical protein